MRLRSKRLSGAAQAPLFVLLSVVVAACSSVQTTNLPTSKPTTTALSSPADAVEAATATAGATASPGGTVTLVAAGDIACDPNANKGTPVDCDQAATADLIGQLHPTAVLTLGDNQYEDNRYGAYQAVFAKTWGKYLSIMHATIGNHEYLTKDAAGYFQYFGPAAGPPGQGYYSFDLGAWHIISLDSECQYIGGCRAGSPEVQWLQNDLATHPNLCTLVAWHEPVWSSGEHGDASQMDTIWQMLVDAKVDVVLSGHNHDYERFVPLNGQGQPDPNGTPEFVVGTGGKNHYGFVEPPLPGEVVRNDKSFGVILMSLTPNGYSWRFVPAAGYTFTDSGSASCH